MIDDEDLKNVLLELNAISINLFTNFYCDECNSSLEDYGCDPLIFGEDDFADRFLCYKCAADFRKEEDYYSKKIETDYENIIIIESNKPGRARIRGMQTTVYEVLKSLATGMTENDFFKKFPSLTRQHILACLAFAADREKGFL